MQHSLIRRAIALVCVLGLIVICGKYLLGLLLPFLLGLGLALAAEPGVRLLIHRLRLGRGPAALISVSVTLLLLTGLILLLCSVLVRELTNLAGILPDLEDTARQGLTALQDWLLSLARIAPEGVRSLLTRMVLRLYSGGSEVYDQVISQLPAIATSALSHISDGALGFGTGILSAYLFSVRLPLLRQWFGTRLPQRWHQQILPVLRNLKTAVWGWLRAQAKLTVITFAIVTGGLLALQVSHAPIWAFLIALVDAVPMLGTGLILVPWSLVSFLQDSPIRALGLLGIFAAATLSRSILEPRLLGKQLGLDPLITLFAMYLGYQFFGIVGLILSPILAVAAIQLINISPAEQ